MQRLKLKYDHLLSNFAFKCNLRHYIMGAWSHSNEDPIGAGRLDRVGESVAGAMSAAGPYTVYFVLLNFGPFVPEIAHFIGQRCSSSTEVKLKINKIALSP